MGAPSSLWSQVAYISYRLSASALYVTEQFPYPYCQNFSHSIPANGQKRLVKEARASPVNSERSYPNISTIGNGRSAEGKSASTKGWVGSKSGM